MNTGPTGPYLVDFWKVQKSSKTSCNRSGIINQPFGSDYLPPPPQKQNKINTSENQEQPKHRLNLLALLKPYWRLPAPKCENTHNRNEPAARKHSHLKKGLHPGVLDAPDSTTLGHWSDIIFHTMIAMSFSATGPELSPRVCQPDTHKYANQKQQSLLPSKNTEANAIRHASSV